MNIKYLPTFLLLAGLSHLGLAGAPPNLAGCPVYPPDHILNTPIDSLPVHPSSASYLSRIGVTAYLHPDFGPNTTQGIPYNVVDSRTQPMVPITIAYTADSDPGPYPIPTNAVVEGGVDKHVLALDKATCKLYEMFGAVPQTNGTWSTKSGAIFDLKSYSLRGYGKGSADAAGLAILPGLVRYQEIVDGEINHAIRFTVPKTRREFVWPARHWAAYTDDPTYPAMGQRFRLKQSFDISSFSPASKVILTAMKKYGIIVSDNGGAWFFQAAPDSRWDIATINGELKGVRGSNFEAVDVSSLMIDINSGQARTSALGAALDGVATSAASVAPGQSFTLTAKIQGEAPAGGLPVTLTSSNSGLIAVPVTLTIPAGAISASTTLKAQTVTAPTAVTLGALSNGVQKTTSVKVTPWTLSGASLYVTSVTGGGTANFRVSINGTAPPEGVTVNLTSSNSTLAAINATGVIPAGASLGSFPVATSPVAAPTTVTLTASYAGSTRSSILTLTPATLSSIKLYPTSGVGGSSNSLFASTSANAPPAGTVIALTSSRPDLIALPATMTVPAGTKNGSLRFTVKAVTASTPVTITATRNGVTKQAVFTIVPPTS